MKKKGVDYIVETRQVRRRRLSLKPLFAFIMSGLFTMLVISSVKFISGSNNSLEDKSNTNSEILTEVSDFKQLDEITEGVKLDLSKDSTEKTDEEASEPAPVSGNRVVYLTFYAGPGNYTAKLLDILKKYNVKATFFVTCKGADDLIKREFNEGHTVGLHTCSHVYDIYSSVDTYFNDLNSISNRVSKLTGEEAKLIRFPGGSSNTVSAQYKKGIMTTLTSEVEKRGYTYFDWNVASRDTENASSAEAVYQNVINGINNRGAGSFSVVLQHDVKSYSVDAVEKIIQYGLSNGYEFRALSSDSPTTHHRVNN